MNQKTYFCPRCRTKTLKIQGDMLICEKCCFTVGTEILEIKTMCITPDDLRFRAPSYLLGIVKKMLREGKLAFVKKFDIVTGRELLCLEPRTIKSENTLEIVRKLETLLCS